MRRFLTVFVGHSSTALVVHACRFSTMTIRTNIMAQVNHHESGENGDLAVVNTSHLSDSGSTFTRPRFDQLPLQPHHPKGSAWGLWGTDDERGTLNLVTAEVVRSASLEVSCGKAVSLK
jgi:hypothetical protein